MTYPLSFREHVLSIRKKEGLTLSEASLRFGIGRASLVRWVKEITPKVHPARRRKLDLLSLQSAIIAHPYRYQYEHAAFFNVSRKAIWQGMKKLNISYKKNTIPSQGGRSGAYIIQKENHTL